MPRSLAVLLLLGGVSVVQSQTAAAPATHTLEPGDLPVWSSALTQPNRYLAAHGLRGFAGGYSEDGLEFWSFPLQLVSGYQLSFDVPGAPSTPALGLLTSFEVDPLGVTRVYTAPDYRVRERITTHAEDPGVLVRFTVEGRRDLRIQVHFRPSLNLMWPAGIGGQEVGWDAAAHGFLLSEPTHTFRALIASPEVKDHTETNNDRRNSTFDRVWSMTLDPQDDTQTCGAGRCATLVLAGQSEAGEEVHATAAALLRAARERAAGDAARFAGADLVEITTPDAEANRAIRWAQIALEQAWTCNARLGCGLVAGYGPSHGARRPQYAWYFAGDGLVATQALLHEGDFKRAAAELDFLFRYQNPENGMMWHEMSQSAGLLHWAKDYPYMYVHVDITFDFLTVLAKYVRITGDQAFIRQHWDAIQRSYRYCLSTLDGSDGLPRVPGDKMSGNEQDRLTDELTLSAAWVQAAHAMAELAGSMQETALAHTAEQASARARDSIQHRYWNEPARHWISGFTRSGAAGESASGAALAAISSGAATPAQAAQTLDELATSAYQTSWGLRSKPSTAPDYDPTSYGKGSVWGLGTAEAAGTLWQAHRPETANRLWLSLVPWAAADSLGHMHELMSGAFFTPQRESVPEQTWSSAAFLSAAVGGLLGLDIQGGSNTLTFSPQVPASWKRLEIRHVRVGASVVDLAWHTEAGHFFLDVRSTGPVVHLKWTQPTPEASAAAARSIERDIAPGMTALRLR